VHHIDKNKENNSVENLYLFSGKDAKQSAQMHNAAHESLEKIAIELFKKNLVEFMDGKYEMKTELINFLAAQVL
jgi:hypothetical protein